MTARRRWPRVAGVARATRHGPPGHGPTRHGPPLATLLLALAAPLACAPAPSADAAAELIVHGARVWDGTGAELGEPAVLRVAAGRILSFEPLAGDADFAAAAEAAEAAGVPAVDATGQFIIPGLINVHGHVGGTWIPGSGVEYAEYAVSELARYARFGVTTVNSLGGDREPVFAIRDASWRVGTGAAEGAGAGEGAGTDEGADPSGSPRARLLVAGPVVTGASPEEVTAGVDAAAAMGPDWIKIRVDDNLGTATKMSPESYGAVIARAAEHGLRVASHLFYHEDAKGLLRAGTGLVAHSIRDEAVDGETIGLFHETGVCYVPTLTREVSTYA